LRREEQEQQDLKFFIYRLNHFSIKPHHKLFEEVPVNMATEQGSGRGVTIKYIIIIGSRLPTIFSSSKSLFSSMFGA